MKINHKARMEAEEARKQKDLERRAYRRVMKRANDPTRSPMSKLEMLAIVASVHYLDLKKSEAVQKQPTSTRTTRSRGRKLKVYTVDGVRPMEDSSERSMDEDSTSDQEAARDQMAMEKQSSTIPARPPKTCQEVAEVTDAPVGPCTNFKKDLEKSEAIQEVTQRKGEYVTNLNKDLKKSEPILKLSQATDAPIAPRPSHKKDIKKSEVNQGQPMRSYATRSGGRKLKTYSIDGVRPLEDPTSVQEDAATTSMIIEEISPFPATAAHLSSTQPTQEANQVPAAVIEYGAKPKKSLKKSNPAQRQPTRTYTTRAGGRKLKVYSIDGVRPMENTSGNHAMDRESTTAQDPAPGPMPMEEPTTSPATPAASSTPPTQEITQIQAALIRLSTDPEAIMPSLFAYLRQTAHYFFPRIQAEFIRFVDDIENGNRRIQQLQPFLMAIYYSLTVAPRTV